MERKTKDSEESYITLWNTLCEPDTRTRKNEIEWYISKIMKLKCKLQIYKINKRDNKCLATIERLMGIKMLCRNEEKKCIYLTYIRVLTITYWLNDNADAMHVVR